MNAYLLIAVWYAFTSVVAFIAYGVDKRAATRGRWRIGEMQLHMWSIVGGFAGAWIGQRVFRHKRRKVRFMVVFWLTVFVHAAGWSVWLYIRYN